MKDLIRKILRENNELESLKELINGENYELALITSEGLGLKEKVVELIINKILNDIKTDIEENIEYYSEDLVPALDFIVKIDVIDLDSNEKGLVATVNTNTEGVLSYYDFDPIYSEIEYLFKKLTSERLRIKENEIIKNKIDRNW